jgi:hypothetical protein
VADRGCCSCVAEEAVDQSLIHCDSERYRGTVRKIAVPSRVPRSLTGWSLPVSCARADELRCAGEHPADLRPRHNARYRLSNSEERVDGRRGVLT